MTDTFTKAQYFKACKGVFYQLMHPEQYKSSEAFTPEQIKFTQVLVLGAMTKLAMEMGVPVEEFVVEMGYPPELAAIFVKRMNEEIGKKEETLQ